MKNNTTLIMSILLMFLQSVAFSQDLNKDNLPVREYNISIDEKLMTINGKQSKGMAINNTIPGPTLEFNEGEFAVIHVKNNMDTETSVHWHGLLLPSYQDGVPYLTTPPIKPGETLTYQFPIKQSGTYWYHSHTMLQEQKGVYGSIVIHPKQETIKVDKEIVIVLSDWTNEEPMKVLKNLKRGNEWYQIKKGTDVPLSKVIKEGAFGAQLKFWRDRMEGADIADVAYDAFLSNGKEVLNLSELKPGEKVRVRMINGSASTIFWLSFGGEIPTMVASDGVDIEPVKRDKLLFSIAETYDFIFTIPDNGKAEIKATAQDGSGSTSIYLGSGTMVYAAPSLVKPDKIKMMKDMAKMDMKMGAPAIVLNPKSVNPEVLKNEYGMKMNHSSHNMNMSHGDDTEMDHTSHDMSKMKMEDDKKMEHMHHGEGMEKMDHSEHNMLNHVMGGEFTYDEAMKYANYDYLKALEKTSFDKSIPVKEMTLNLTGNMNRYVWSINGAPLSEADNILIKGGEVTRIKLNNMTMMHHPMHLHGHFFRVLNKNGEYSPLKHTVNVPPMEEVTIEFYNAAGEGDWLFHCHVLYHMMGGMTRIFSYGTPRDPRMEMYSPKTLINETDHLFNWNTLQIGSQMAEADFVWSTIRNEFIVKAETDYKSEAEFDVSYNRYLNSFLRAFVGVNGENEGEEKLNDWNIVGVAGLKWFTPYMFNVTTSIDHQMRLNFAVNKEIMIFHRTFLEGELKYRSDFGIVNDLGDNNYQDKLEWDMGLEYILSRDFSIKANYHNHYGLGAGAILRF